MKRSWLVLTAASLVLSLAMVLITALPFAAVRAQPALSLAATVSPASVRAGQTVTYELTVSNLSTAAATSPGRTQPCCRSWAWSPSG